MKHLKKTLKTPLKINWEAAFLPILFIYYSGVIGIIYYVLLMLGLFVHEYSHAYMANKYKFGVQDITIHFFGAFARIQNPQKLLVEQDKTFWVVFAGPASSFILAIIGTALGIFTGSQLALMFGIMNFILCIFNIIPVYPMDGGRIFLSIASRFTNLLKALKITEIVSYVFIGTLFVLGIIYGWYMASAVMVIMAVLGYIEIKQEKKFLRHLYQHM